MDRHPASLQPPGPATRRRHRRWTPAAGLLVAVALLASLFGFGLSRDPTVVHSVLVGRRAPAFALPQTDGDRTFRLADYRGHVVVVNFWASWCVDCRVEHPALSAAWD